MFGLRLLIYTLVISKTVKVVSGKKKRWQYDTVSKYGTVRLFCNGTGKESGTVRFKN